MSGNDSPSVDTANAFASLSVSNTFIPSSSSSTTTTTTTNNFYNNNNVSSSSTPQQLFTKANVDLFMNTLTGSSNQLQQLTQQQQQIYNNIMTLVNYSNTHIYNNDDITIIITMTIILSYICVCV